MIALYIIPGLIGLCLLLVLAAVIKTMLTPAKTSDFEPKKDPEREQAYAEKLSKMVQVETVSVKDQPDPEKYRAYHRVLEELFPLTFSTMEKMEIDGNLLLKWTGKSSERPVILMSHQDVVAAEGEWKKDPFGGEISEGKVWGRGSADTKCSALAFYQACEEMIREGYVPAQDIYLSSSCTEEVGGDGCPKLVEEIQRRGVKPWLVIDEGGAIVREPISGCKGNFAMIGVVEKGHGDLEFIARSSGGHSSYPGKNSPIARLAALVTDVEKHHPMKAEFIPQARSMFETMAPYGPFYLRLLFGNFWLFKGLLKKVLPSISAQAGALIRTTVAFTMQSGSEGRNVMPQEAHLIANLRYAPHQGMEESNAIMQKLADKHGVEMKVLDARDFCPPVSIESDAFHYVEKAVNKVFPGLPTCPYVMTGGTDARFYSEICDACIRFAPVLYGPEQMKGMHGLNECVDTVSLPGAVDFFKEIIEGL